jgi:hypothetical protein
MRTKGKLSSMLQVQLLKSVFEFMRRSGLTQDEIRRAITNISNASGNSKDDRGDWSGDPSYVGNGNISAEVIRVWHRDSRYINKAARPAPLRTSGVSPTLATMIRNLDPTVDPGAVIASMRSVGLIRRLRSGSYLPTASSVTIGQLHPLSVEHVAKSVIRLVTTVCRNTDQSGNSLPLVERYAYVPDLSRKAARDFSIFSREQGMAYLEAVDDWLEKRRVVRQLKSRRDSADTGITAGVHLVAFLGDTNPRRKAPTNPSKQKAGLTPRRTVEVMTRPRLTPEARV